MQLGRLIFSGGVLVCGMAAGANGFAAAAQSAPAPSFSRCEIVKGGVEYRSFLPDQRRFLFVQVKMLPGVFPSIFIIVDKNFTGKPVKEEPALPWWLDRSQPFVFSDNRVKIAWSGESTLGFITGLFSSIDKKGVTQTLLGLEPKDGHFEGQGNNDNNAYAFQTRVEMPGFSGDEFDVTFPAVSYDGVTVAPPRIHFDRSDRDAPVKC
jgi:hypothetical protein